MMIGSLTGGIEYHAQTSGIAAFTDDRMMWNIIITSAGVFRRCGLLHMAERLIFVQKGGIGRNLFGIALEALLQRDPVDGGSLERRAGIGRGREEDRGGTGGE